MEFSDNVEPTDAEPTDLDSLVMGENEALDPAQRRPLVRVLLIEGNTEDARRLRKLLQSLREFKVRLQEVDCLAAALEDLEDNAYEAVFVDLILPDSADWEGVDRLRNRFPNVPLFVLGQRVAEEDPGEDAWRYEAEYFDKSDLEPPVLVGALRLAQERCRRQAAENALAQAEHEMKVARQIQRSILPRESPLLPGLEIAGKSDSAAMVGGDYFDYLSMPRDVLGVVVGDVMGHGLGPALLAAQTAACLRSLAYTKSAPGRVLNLANQVLTESSDEDVRFVTMMLLGVDWQTRQIWYANAGHPPARIIGSDGALKAELQPTGFPLAMVPDAEYETAGPVKLEPGDVLYCVSDGILEAKPPEGRQFGKDRLLELVQRFRHRSAGEIVDDVFFSLGLYCQGVPHEDDMTMVVVKGI
jgi:sigma-B regulation protein RsbU (phosphoserine phosphatase)